MFYYFRSGTNYFPTPLVVPKNVHKKEHDALRAKLPLLASGAPGGGFLDAPLRNPETLFFRYVKKWPDSSTESSAFLFSVISVSYVDTLFYFGFCGLVFDFGSGPNIRAAVSSSEAELHIDRDTGRETGYFRSPRAPPKSARVRSSPRKRAPRRFRPRGNAYCRPFPAPGGVDARETAIITHRSAEEHGFRHERAADTQDR
uniref:Uncharacterized protein n=1 Tax=Candidatus Kentrum sp. DK TaxID=2126562 RepID=A0A450TL06_9GAMM|nr:MAG: hypothetical protein BECKDK2373B_GA0170837_12103 [Candidatus Kentron sp. DK]